MLLTEFQRIMTLREARLIHGSDSKSGTPTERSRWVPFKLPTGQIDQSDPSTSRSGYPCQRESCPTPVLTMLYSQSCFFFVVVFFNMERFTSLHVVLARGHANLLCIVPILAYALPKGALTVDSNRPCPCLPGGLCTCCFLHPEWSPWRTLHVCRNCLSDVCLNGSSSGCLHWLQTTRSLCYTPLSILSLSLSSPHHYWN